MENQLEASNMMMMFERMLQEQRAMSKITASMEQLVQRNGQFNEKDVSRYLRDYKAEMLRCGISEGLQVTSFNWVAIDRLQASIHVPNFYLPQSVLMIGGSFLRIVK